MQNEHEDTVIVEDVPVSYPASYTNGHSPAVTTLVPGPLRAAVPWARFYKRMMDLVLVTVTGVVWVPLLAILAVWIKLDSRGAVFFTQDRPGRRGKHFRIFKFRTMLDGAGDMFDALTPEQKDEFERYGKIQDDPRVTRIGKWLRRFSLDELPQLLNVFRGDMSLVGPRPYLQEQLPQLAHTDVIFEVRPGLTGLWQISGRSLLPLEKRIDLDVSYVRDWTPWMDLKIILKTVKVVVKSTGAF